MKRAFTACLALLAPSLTPIAPPPLIATANAQPAPPSCAATNKIGEGFTWGDAYIIPGPYDYRIEFDAVPDVGIKAIITARSPLTIRCPVLNGDKPIGKYGTNQLATGQTLEEIVCAEGHLTEAGKQLGVKEENVCVAGGSWDNR